LESGLARAEIHHEVGWVLHRLCLKPALLRLLSLQSTGLLSFFYDQLLLLRTSDPCISYYWAPKRYSEIVLLFEQYTCISSFISLILPNCLIENNDDGENGRWGDLGSVYLFYVHNLGGK
jgi:hypothetical protein